MDSVQSQVEELPENRVRLTVQVPSHDVHHAVEHAADDLAQSVKVPGFRKGKVPRQVLLQRVGHERLMTEAVESHIGGWFWNAAARSRVRPVAQPDYDFELPATDDQDWQFTATVAVQAKPELPDWTKLEVGVAEVEVPEELVQHELDALRATVAELVPVEGRPVGPEDTVVVDLVAEDETRRDYVVDLGRGAARQVEARGVQLETFLAMTGQQPEELVALLQDEAEHSVARELVLDAVAEQLGLDVPDADVEELVREQAEAVGDDADEMLVALRESGRFESLREDLRLRNALDHVAGEVKRIPLAQAEAREAIWTPDKENPPTETKLWTPDQQPPDQQHSEGVRS